MSLNLRVVFQLAGALLKNKNAFKDIGSPSRTDPHHPSPIRRVTADF